MSDTMDEYIKATEVVRFIEIREGIIESDFWGLNILVSDKCESSSHTFSDGTTKPFVTYAIGFDKLNIIPMKVLKERLRNIEMSALMILATQKNEGDEFAMFTEESLHDAMTNCGLAPCDHYIEKAIRKPWTITIQADGSVKVVGRFCFHIIPKNCSPNNKTSSTDIRRGIVTVG